MHVAALRASHRQEIKFIRVPPVEFIEQNVPVLMQGTKCLSRSVGICVIQCISPLCEYLIRRKESLLHIPSVSGDLVGIKALHFSSHFSKTQMAFVTLSVAWSHVSYGVF